MTDEKKDVKEESERERTQAGEPGRTPGSAEGDRETVEASLEEETKRRDGQKGDR